jgi:DNA-binding transcriptional LysR family regulator
MRSLALIAEGELLYARSTRILDDGREAENAISKARAVPKGRPKISVPTVLGWRVIVLRCRASWGLTARLNSIYGWMIARSTSSMRISMPSFGWANSLTLVLSRGRSRLTISQPAQRKAILPRTGPQRRRLNSSPIAAYDTAFPPQDGSSNGRLRERPRRKRSAEAWFSTTTRRSHAGRWQASGWFRFRPYLVSEDLAAGRLQRLLVQRTADRGDIQLVWPEVRADIPRVRVFVDFVSKLPSAQAPTNWQYGTAGLLGYAPDSQPRWRTNLRRRRGDDRQP